MPIERNCPYFSFPKKIAQDERLSFSARGFLCYLESIGGAVDECEKYSELIDELIKCEYIMKNEDGNYYYTLDI